MLFSILNKYIRHMKSKSRETAYTNIYTISALASSTAPTPILLKARFILAPPTAHALNESIYAAITIVRVFVVPLFALSMALRQLTIASSWRGSALFPHVHMLQSASVWLELSLFAFVYDCQGRGSVCVCVCVHMFG